MDYRKEFFIKSGDEHIKLAVDDIIYIHSDADYTEIHTSDKKLLSSESLRYRVENLDAQNFAQVHKSFVLNAMKIEKVSGNQVYLSEGNVIPVGRAYKEGFLDRFIKQASSFPTKTISLLFKDIYFISFFEENSFSQGYP